MSKHKLSNQALLNKVKLWCVLHDTDIDAQARSGCNCNKCPNRLMGTGEGCKIKWGQRLATTTKMDTINHYYDSLDMTYYCIEWAKYV